MPVIIKDQEQEAALNTIANLLKEVEQCNDSINNPSTQYTLLDGKIKIALNDKFSKEIKATVKKHRKELVKQIQTLSTKYRIGLDDKELAAISAEALKKDAEEELIDA